MPAAWDIPITLVPEESDPALEGYTVFKPNDANPAWSADAGVQNDGQTWTNVLGGSQIHIGMTSAFAGRANVKVGYTLEGTEPATITTLSFAEGLPFELAPAAEVAEVTARVAVNEGGNSFGVFTDNANVKISYIAVENLTQGSDLNVRFNITPKDADVTVTVNDVAATNTERYDFLDYSVTTFTGYNAGDTLNYTITAPGYQTQTGTAAAAWNIPITLVPETVTSTTVTFNVTPADAYVTLNNVRKQAEGGVCTFSDINTEQTLNYTVAAPGFVYEAGAVEIVENTEKTVSLMQK